MSWVTENWRLKVMALGLSVLMLGAVAFAQNPPTFKTLTITNFEWQIPPGLIVINAPTRATVRVNGLADTIQTVTADRLKASFDLSKVKPGPAVIVNLVVTPSIGGVLVQNSSVPFSLNVDRRATVPLTVKVRPPAAAPGWVVTKADARCPTSPCVVHFDGPAGWETDAANKANLNAYVDLLAPVAGEKIIVGNLPVKLEQGGTPLDSSNFTKTVPQSGLDISAVEVQTEARTATTTKQVVLIASPPSRAQPAGYRVTGIAIDPFAVVVTGRADRLVGITNITLPPVDLSGRTANATFTVTIPYQAGVSGSVQTARITYSISRDPNVQPTPSPA